MVTTTVSNDRPEASALAYRVEDVEERPRVLILEGQPGAARRACLQNYLKTMASSGARTFSVSCDFDVSGPWAGVTGLLSVLLPEIQEQRPDLVARHSLELVYIFPELRRTLAVRNPNLTDLAQGPERTRNYPADRAYRNAHGLIDLLDSWKTAVSLNTPWVIACDDFDLAGAMGSLLFRELMRRRGQQLNIRLLVSVGPGNGPATRASFDDIVRAELIALDLPAEPLVELDPDEAARQACSIEERINGDLLETKVHLADLIRLWRTAGRRDKFFQYKFFGLETYNTAGLYADALRYGEGLLDLASKHVAGDDYFRWSIVLKLIMSHLGLEDAASAMRLAEEEGQPLAQRHPDLQVDLYYLLAMFCSRFTKPRDFAKGEEYLASGLLAIEQAGLSEGQYHFKSVFNRNGLAMIRNFQRRHQDAIELCRAGIERLNMHLSADEHRLHRSVLFYNMAQVYAATGSHDEAIKYYSVAMDMDPNYSEYYNERGNVFLRLGRLEEAKADYLTAIELSPPYFEVFANLGQCYRRMGGMDSAIDSYSRALDLEPRHALALLGRAKAHEELGHSQAAIADYSAALSLDPAIWEALASRAVLRYELGELDASLTDLNHAIQLKPDSADLYQNRATLFADLGRFEEAVEDLRAALQLNPSEGDRLSIHEKLEQFSLAAQNTFAR